MHYPVIYSWKEAVSHLNIDERWQEAARYLTPLEQLEGLTLQRLWSILDKAWEETLKENGKQEATNCPEFLNKYYQHPVWIINAAFSESDPATISDRLAAVRLISHVQPQKILDFGGGIGTVSRLCSISLPEVKAIDLVDITEFRHIIKHHLADFPNIRILEQPEPPYDAVISTEVLEHVIDPIETLIEINRLLRIGGTFAVSWSFVPCIKCHLQQNFHLNRLIFWIIRSLGFGFYGFERRGSIVYSFVKTADVKPRMIQIARLLELGSRFPIPLDRLMLMLRGL
jgi:2-polyprenyl-3-methyl-5-hydroxy-6-metoxy-1,4-benzoquinol methylase